MATMSPAEEEDVHFCMRCKTEVHGLEKYIQHRKDGCPGGRRASARESAARAKSRLDKENLSEGESKVEDDVKPEELLEAMTAQEPDDSLMETEADAEPFRTRRPRRKQKTPKVRALYVDHDGISDDEPEVKYKPSKRGRKPKGGRKSSTKGSKSSGTPKKVPKKEKQIYTCDCCGFVSYTEKRLTAHNNTAMHQEMVARDGGASRVFNCHMCQESFCLERALRTHNRVHSANAVCQECQTSFQTKSSLRKHLEETGHTTKYTCSVCNKDFPIEAHLKVHMTVHMEEKPFACNQCEFKTKRRADLNIHLKRHMGIKPFKCTLCPFKSVKRSVLTRHMETHKNRPRDLICEVCGAAYCSKMVLQHHIFTQHQNGRRYPCDFEGCTYIFCYKSELVAHQRSHTKEKPFLCSVCGYEGSNTYALTKHMRIHTKEKPFTCPFPSCNYASRFSAHLVRHKRLHTGEKPYKCPFCNYRCNAQENLRKHVRNTKKHAGKNMYMCKDCEFTTNSYKELVHHTRSRHGSEYIKLQDVSRACGIFQPGAMSNEGSSNIIDQAFAESLGTADGMPEDGDGAPKKAHQAEKDGGQDVREEVEAELVIDQSGIIQQAITQARNNSLAANQEMRNGEQQQQQFQIPAAPQGTTDYLVIGQVYGGRGDQHQMEAAPQQLEIVSSGAASATQSVAEAMRCLAQGFDDRSQQVSFVVTNIVHKDGVLPVQGTAPQSQEVAIHTIPQSNAAGQYGFYQAREALPSHSRSGPDAPVATPVQLIAATPVSSHHHYPQQDGGRGEVNAASMPTTSYQTVAIEALPTTSREVQQVVAPTNGGGSHLPFSQSLVQAVQRVRETTDEVTAVTILEEMDANADRILQQKDNN